MFHAEHVAGVKHRGDNSHQVAGNMFGRHTQAVADHHRGARQGSSHAEQKPGGDLFGKQNPRAECNENRREVGEQRRIGHRGQSDGPVPQRQVAGEEQSGDRELPVVF